MNEVGSAVERRIRKVGVIGVIEVLTGLYYSHLCVRTFTEHVLGPIELCIREPRGVLRGRGLIIDNMISLESNNACLIPDE